MTVIMMLRVKADVQAFESYAAANSEQLTRIAEEGRSRGAIHHMFAAADGELVVIDEWPSEEAFQGFFSEQTEIPQIMEASGAQGEPEVTFLRALDTPDRF